MITNQELMEKVDDFNNDLLQIYIARIEKIIRKQKIKEKKLKN